MEMNICIQTSAGWQDATAQVGNFLLDSLSRFLQNKANSVLGYYVPKLHILLQVVVTTEGKSMKLIIRESSMDDQGVYSCVLKDKKCSSSVLVHGQ